ncbi:uncharacterized protein N7483_003253 [Penicillium malachiteum]|uniref:uncharacterized protein n=1 Tax=Penicillium malachiteum TaxID=1324776 RepID=UPI002546EE8A|nr:uncharacterized protein N7483_003253 [Penicillium malachiteum]KAJ5728745.1 hypothetical protein N7483_003253 [Penicillium malachiteum]
MPESAPNWDFLFSDPNFIKSYENGERVTGTFAETLIEQSDIVAGSKADPECSLVILDNACGTGVVSSILHRDIDDHVKGNWKVTCGDIAEGMLQYARRRVQRDKWINSDVKTVDVQDTKLPSGHFTHVFTSFAFMAVPRSLTALDETTRILQPGGVIGFTTWIQPGWVPIMKKAIDLLPGRLPWPTADEFLRTLGEGKLWDSPAWIENQLKERGFCDINVTSVTKSNPVSVSDFVDMAMFMVPIVIEYFWSEKMRQESKDKIKPVLEKYLIDTYGENGEVSGEWMAIVSTARKASP